MNPRCFIRHFLQRMGLGQVINLKTVFGGTNQKLKNKSEKIKDNFGLYLKLLQKKIRDMKLRKKMILILIVITVSACLAIGISSYRISSKSIISNSETMSVNLMKQIGLNLDERIDAFSDLSYRILQTSSVINIIRYDKGEGIQNRNESNSSFNTAILQQSSLYSYTKYALLRPENGIITEYYKAREKKLGIAGEEEILDYLQEYVSISNPTNWVRYNNEIYFVRKIVDTSGKPYGILCFAMTDKFFSFVGTDQDILSNNGITIVGPNEMILKQYDTDLTDSQIREIVNYKKSNYYVYNGTIQIRGLCYAVVALNTAGNDWTIVGFMPYATLLKDLNHILMMIIWVIIIVSAGGVVIASILSRTITSNLRVIEQGMKNYENGNFDLRIKPKNYDEIGLLALQFNYMGLKISDLIHQLEEEEKSKRILEYKTLQAQINPHFLYNTLGSIKWSAFRKGEKETADSVDALINLLRFTIKHAAQILPLKEEIDYIKNYICIEKLRYGKAFEMKYKIQNSVLNWNIPGFILQPFIENALIHGLDLAAEDPYIILRAREYNKMLYLEIEDNGIGMDEETLKQIWTKEDNSYQGLNSIGIKIVDGRLHKYYGDKYRTVIKSKLGNGTKVTLVIPKMEENNV